jgi:poly(beta-D-mannuronate) lyase
VTRHGNYCTIDGNYFIGDENNNVGGVRLINTGHWVTNNYFYNLKGEEFRSPLAVMNGIPKSPLNRYNQVTDVVVAYNSWINCKSPWHFGVGTNISQADVLPKSEIRSARPVRTVVANNLIYNENGDKKPLVAHDKIDGITFKSNLINNNGEAFDTLSGLAESSFGIDKVAEGLFVPTGLKEVEPYQGFDFEVITNDIFGNDRSKVNSIGAICKTPANVPDILDKKIYGASWFSNEIAETTPQTLTATPNDLAEKIAAAKNGDIVELTAGLYEISNSLVINKKVTIQSKDENNQAQLKYVGAAKTPAFELHPKGDLTLQKVKLMGQKTQYTFSNLKENMSSLYNLTVANAEISDFDYVLKAYKQTFADDISFTNTTLKNCQNGIELSEETNDKGDYNAEFLTVDNCQFENIKKNVIDYYRGGYDESTIGGNLLVTNSTFTNCGAGEENGILLNTRGIINVNIAKNTFKNNSVKLVALLWGAKNNTHSDNQIVNSGKIVVEENLKLKLMY